MVTTQHLPAPAALALIIRSGFQTCTTPSNCKGSAEQAGFDAFQDGFLTLDAIHLSHRYTMDDELTEWLAGIWKAHEEEETKT
jgi:hypothetical protein